MRFRMARLKQTPVKSSPPQKTDQKSTRKRRKATKRGATDLASAASVGKRQRSQSKTESKVSKTQRKSRAKGGGSDDYLPPELRQAGLLAHQSIMKGKCFGPFKGQFIKTGKKPLDDHSFVCKIKGVDKMIYLFYVHNDEQEKCMWLQRLQSASSKKAQNIVAYKSAVGVCYEATCDIKPGEELLVLYDDTYGGKRYPAYVENIPVHFVPDAGQLQVVPLDDSPVTAMNQQEDEARKEDQTIKDTENSREEEDEHEDDNDAENDDSDENDDEASADGNDADYIDDDDDDDEQEDVVEMDDDSDTDYKQKKGSKRKGKKPALRRKVIFQVYEIKTVDEQNNTETLKYQCSYCGTVHSNKEQADQHVSSEICKDKEFICKNCGCLFESNLIMTAHKCIKNLKCSVCDTVFLSNKLLLQHTRKATKDENHKPRCSQCQWDFENMEQKTEHLQEKHNEGKDIYNCPVCDKIYSNLSYLREHIQTHSVDAFKCPECQKQFSSKSNLHKHIRKHSPTYIPAKDKRRSGQREKRHECHECEKKFDTPHGLEVHIRSHTGERPFECDLCHWKFSQKPHLKRHINTVHRSEGDKPTPPKSLPPAELPKTCELCNKVYANSRVLRVHLQSVHQKERPHKCNYCETTFTQRGHLWRHKHSFHPNCEEVQKKIQTSGCVCKVDDCKQAFPCQTELLSHMSTAHAANWPYTCEKCDATFANSSNLRKHIRRRHAEEEGMEKPFTCETCSKEFDSMYKLTQHKRTHTGEKDFKCDLCGQSFVQKSGLRKHIRCRRCPKIDGSPIRQLSKKKYECEECSRVFPGPSDLRSHLRTHTGEKPFECSECHKKFSQTGNLTKHIKYVHQKLQRPKDKPREKKFHCSLCGKAFACPSSLAMHCRTHTGNKPFKCDKCEAAFAQQGNLKKHLKRWHNPDASSTPKRRRKKKGEASSEADPASEGLDQGDTIETIEDNDTSQSQSLNTENNDVDDQNQSDEGTNEDSAEERARAEQTAIASILTSINSEAFLNPRGFTPLNTPTQGFFISPIPQAPSTLGPAMTRASIIMTPNGSAQIQVPQPIITTNQPTNNMDTRANSIFVPPFASTTVSVPQGTPQGSTDSTQANTTILPHVNTILSPQINPPHFGPHTSVGQVPEVTLYPFSPTSLFQH